MTDKKSQMVRVSATHDLLSGYWRYLHALDYRTITLRKAQEDDLFQESDVFLTKEIFDAFDATTNFARTGDLAWQTCLDGNGQPAVDESGQPVRYPLTPQALTRLAGEIREEYGAPIRGTRRMGVDVTPERIAGLMDAYKTNLVAIEGALQRMKATGDQACIRMYRNFFLHQTFTAINNVHHFIEKGDYINHSERDQNGRIVFDEDGNRVHVPQSPEVILAAADVIRAKQF